MIGKKEIRKKIISVMLLITIFFITIVSTQTGHIEFCEDDDCAKCSIIETAISLIKNIHTLIQHIIIQLGVIIALSTIINRIIIRNNSTLVSNKVKLNE